MSISFDVVQMPASNWTFVEATNRLTEIGLSLGAVADRFGVRRETVSRWRREGGAYPPPDDWPEILAQLAEERGYDLRELAASLRGSTAEPTRSNR
jgi:transcriptional regulator with XRE-family HTH domain